MRKFSVGQVKNGKECKVQLKCEKCERTVEDRDQGMASIVGIGGQVTEDPSGGQGTVLDRQKAEGQNWCPMTEVQDWGAGQTES